MNNLLNNSDEVVLYCVRCGREKSYKNMKHTRLYGYMCICGSQGWKERKRTNVDYVKREKEE